MTATFRCSSSQPDGWDDYVNAHPAARIFHTGRAINIGLRAFGLETYFFTASDASGRISGVLPAVVQTLIPWTRTLVSLPFCTYGGPLADDTQSLQALIGGCEQIANLRKVDRIVLRSEKAVTTLNRPASLGKVSMVRDLPSTAEDLAGQLGSKLRSQIKRAEKCSPEIKFGSAELLNDFYVVFRSVMRDLGTPVYPRNFFDVVFDALGRSASVVVIYVHGLPVSAAILVHWRTTVEVPWACTLHSMSSTAMNMRLYWELLKLAISKGCTEFDFGRCSPGDGTHRFKAQWGARPRQLHWYAWSPSSGAQMTHALDARSRLGGMSQLWSKLPAPVANWLGPRISARLPW